jgi:hypothetical protein
MKVILIILNLFIVNALSIAQTQSIDNFIQAHRTAGMSEKVNLTVAGWLVRTGYRVAEKTDELEGIDLRPIVDGIRKLKIHVLEPKEGADKNDEPARKKRFSAVQTLLFDLRNDKFEDLATVRDAKSRVNVLVRENDGLIQDIMVLVHEADDDTVLLQIVGKFRMEDVARIIERAVRKEVKNCE